MTTLRQMPHPMTCDRFLELLPDLLEGDLAGPALAAATAHRAGCARCAEVVAELEHVTRSAAALPTLQPARDLWEGIAARIEAPVLPLAAAPAAARAPAWHRRPWLAAAAVLLLVAGTAGITRQLTLRQLTLRGPGDAPEVALAALAVDAVGRADPAPATGAAVVGESLAVTEVPTATGSRPATRPADAARPPAMQLASIEGTALEAAAAYDEELVALRAVLDERRTSLDSATVRVLESNLAIIDRAIAESRAALLRDPASRFLNERLSTAVQDKLQLMRTAVLISND